MQSQKRPQCWCLGCRERGLEERSSPEELEKKSVITKTVQQKKSVTKKKSTKKIRNNKSNTPWGKTAFVGEVIFTASLLPSWDLIFRTDFNSEYAQCRYWGVFLSESEGNANSQGSIPRSTRGRNY
jgi:hypothetical protein